MYQGIHTGLYTCCKYSGFSLILRHCWQNLAYFWSNILKRSKSHLHMLREKLRFLELRAQYYEWSMRLMAWSVTDGPAITGPEKRKFRSIFWFFWKFWYQLQVSFLRVRCFASSFLSRPVCVSVNFFIFYYLIVITILLQWLMT